MKGIAVDQVLRIVDANFNRAREALRVMEESARFILNNTSLTESLKKLRHDLSQAIATCPACVELTEHRQTQSDVGTQLSTSSEQTRVDAAHVVLASGKRLSEALRTLEEYAKTLDQPGITLANKIKVIRYQGYQLEQQLNTAMSPDRKKQWRLCVLLSRELCPNGDSFSVAQAAINGGADCLQIREKALEGRQFLDLAKKIVALAKPAGVDVIINDRPDIAILSNADGVHVGQDDLPCDQVRKLVGGKMIIGVSTSRLEQAKEALQLGADYCGTGPMFTSSTKHKDVIVGPEYLRQYLSWGQLPHLAIGGICFDNLNQLINIGVKGVAVSSAVCKASDPKKVVKSFIDQLANSK